MPVDPIEDAEKELLEATKKQLLEAFNELRAFQGRVPLTAFPENHCSFCGEAKEDAGPLVQGIAPFIFICRQCTVDAQHAFLRNDSPTA